MVRSTSPVSRGSPQRCNAMPPMKQNLHPRTRQNDWTSSARRNRSCISLPGEDRLLLHQPGAVPCRTRKRGLECAVQGLDVVSHPDVAETFAPKVLEPRGGCLPRFDEGAQLGIPVVAHSRSLIIRGPWCGPRISPAPRPETTTAIWIGITIPAPVPVQVFHIRPERTTSRPPRAGSPPAWPARREAARGPGRGLRVRG